MDAGDWIALGGTVLALVIHSIAVAMFLARLAGKVETNSKAIEALISGKVSTEQGKGFQAQIDRLERADAECDGKLIAQRQESADRMERLGARLAAHEQTQSAQNTTLTAAVTRMEALMEGMRDAINRMAAGQRDRAPTRAEDGLLGDLERLVRIAPLLKQLGAAA